MLLSTLLHKKRLVNVATAIPAIPATEPPKRDAATVARIATVAIANSSSEKTQKIRVRCCDCQHFIPDAIGSGLGIGECAAGQSELQPTVLWARSERVCNEWVRPVLTGNEQGVIRHE